MHQAPSTPLHTHQLTNNTPKHRTNVATINKLATKTLFSRASHFTRATFHTYLRFKLVIYYVIMVRWFECSQIFSYLAGGWFFNIYSWFYTGFLFRPKFSLRYFDFVSSFIIFALFIIFCHGDGYKHTPN